MSNFFYCRTLFDRTRINTDAHGFFVFVGTKSEGAQSEGAKSEGAKSEGAKNAKFSMFSLRPSRLGGSDQHPHGHQRSRGTLAKVLCLNTSPGGPQPGC